MSGIGAIGHVVGDGGRAGLAAQLHVIADTAKRAATFAEGEYIPQMSRQFELKKAFNDAGRAVSDLEDLAPRIAMLDGGEDGLQLAKAAINNLGVGRQALRDGVVIEDDIVRGGAVVADAVSTGTAGAFFREAESKVRGLADLASIEGYSADELLRGLIG